MERFLQLGSKDNIIVANCTTPGQHVPRVASSSASPLPQASCGVHPKKLLRYPKAVSSMADFTSGGFQEVIDDANGAKGAKTVVLCSGKVYYDLLEKFDGKTPKNMAVIRVEQLHPFPADAIAKALKRQAKTRILFGSKKSRATWGDGHS